MTFRREAIRGVVATVEPGAVDYRLARQSLVSEFRKGRLAKHEVCDAHPELMRVAKNLGEPSSLDCPICADHKLVLVSYVFGSHLPASGRLVTTRAELRKVSNGPGRDLTCYVVEVCPDCGWNHLARTFPVGRRTP